MIKICICGGGSLGHVCAGVFTSHADIELNIYTGHPTKWGHTITVTDFNGKQFVAKIANVSSNPQEVVSNQDIILFCLPGFMIETVLMDIKPFIGNAAVGSVVSSTGFFFFAHHVLGERAKLFGFQRVPFISRVVEYGKTAVLLGYKSSLSVALENITPSESFRLQLERLFLTPVNLLSSFYEVSLTNSNPILHTGRLYTLFKGNEDTIFAHKILFYKDWTNEASQLLIDMDTEFFKLLDKLGVGSIQSLLDYYDSFDAASLTRKISSISAFQTIEAPMIEVPGGWKADFKNRYFTEDFPYGLYWIKDLSEKNNIDTPTIDEVYFWGMDHIGSLLQKDISANKK